MARVNRRLTRASRYGRYDGGPDPLAPPVDLSEALDAIGEDVMAGSSPERALREFLRRRELTSKHNLDGTLREIKELLDRALLEERKQLVRDAEMDDTDRALAEMQLDNLPSSTAAAVNELGRYNWQSRQARQDYEKIKDLLGREMLDQRFAGMKQALENATDRTRAATTPRSSSTSSCRSTVSTSRSIRRTSTNCSTRSPSAPPQPSECATR